MRSTKRLFMTLVLPAPNGCDLKCPFCAIKQRGEGQRTDLSETDYVRFVSDIAAQFPVSALSIQGYEALLPETWPTTRAVLEAATSTTAGQRLIGDTRMVTNGTNLAEHAAILSTLLDTVTVSLDSANPATHDKLRGVRGSWERTAAGIWSACHYFKRPDEVIPHVTVASVLFPGRKKYLDGMLPFLAQYGVPTLEIGPHTNFSRGSLVANEQAFTELRETMLSLYAEGLQHGVNVAFGDEFDRFGSLAEYEDLARLKPRALGERDVLIRLSPEGYCSVGGVEFYAPAENSARWEPAHERPTTFITRIMAEHGIELG